MAAKAQINQLQVQRGLAPASVIHGGVDSVQRALSQLNSKETPIEKYIYLSQLRSSAKDTFYRLLIDNIIDICPYVYTPTVGAACQLYSTIYRKPDALYLSYNDRGHLAQIMANWPQKDIRIAVVSDGSRILGLGDLGIGGCQISVGKLTLYVGGAGIRPDSTLPIILDMGTNNESLLNDPLYLGLRMNRVYDDAFVDEFYAAVRQTYPDCLIQFEDFSSESAFKYLDRYRHKSARIEAPNAPTGAIDAGKCFNDDIQGTGAVILAGFINAVKLASAASGRPILDQRIVFLGAGSAGVGVALQLVEFFTRNGFSEEEAKQKFYLVDSKGLVTDDRGDKLPEHKKSLSRKAGGAQMKTLEEVVENVRPTALIGLSTVGGAFSEKIVKMMASYKARPIIFPLSNPSHLSECTFEDAVKWTNGKVIFASGSPFKAVTHEGKEYESNQGNNFLSFPGIGLGCIVSKASEVNDDMIYESALALSDSLDESEADTLLYPRLHRIRDISATIAARVAKAAVRTGVAENKKLDGMSDDQLIEYIKTKHLYVFLRLSLVTSSKSSQMPPQLSDKGIDLVAVYNVSSGDKADFERIIDAISGSFSWAVRSGSEAGTVLMLLKAHASVWQAVNTDCDTIYDYFMRQYSHKNLKRLIIPHNDALNKTLLHSLTSYSISKEQLTSIRNAFGSSVALYFAFLRSYFRSLTLPALLGLWCWWRHGAFSTAYAVGISIYATAFVEYWRVQEQVLAVEWGVDGVSAVSEASKGGAGAGAEKNKTSPWYIRESKVLLSIPILALFACLLAALLTSIFLVEAFGIHFYTGALKPVVALVPTLLYCGVVPRVVAAYQPTLRWLSEWEGHATHANTTSSHAVKTFAINALVSYGGLALTAYVYIPYGHKLMQIAGELVGSTSNAIDATATLNSSRIQTQLFAYLVTSQAINAFQEVGMPYITSYVERKRRARSGGGGAGGEKASNNDDPQERSYLEHLRNQATRPDYDLFEDYAEMTTQFGYIALWGIVWPLAPVMGLVNNFFEIRGDIVKLLQHCTACRPTPSDSIGVWLNMLAFLAWLGAIINTSLVCLFHDGNAKVFSVTLPSLFNSNVSPFIAALTAALLASHAHFVLKAIFSRLWTFAIWDTSTAAVIVRDRAAALSLQRRHEQISSSDLGERSSLDNDLDCDRSTLNDIVASVAQQNSKKDQ
ncbi:hypothetical protein E3P99_02520 [Wallemia hederae]|uniref:Malic enzyme n=1 Tax=Wallemia hederae TaxID=1540922 RepID=A0A4T0FK60_9BASI|nr:hypothetical protein E3P99_02520 [Wallemia hederae]